MQGKGFLWGKLVAGYWCRWVWITPGDIIEARAEPEAACTAQAPQRTLNTPQWSPVGRNNHGNNAKQGAVGFTPTQSQLI
ncbi:hypothetical protein GF326_02020 [Candidatus Bathyarchaeota archaeon]|nr:hypothetical protein [Candidatus Bathyarchaeota archaeon]